MSGLYKAVLFYRYFPIETPTALCESLLQHCRSCSLMGRILVAEEGLNGTLAGFDDNIDKFISVLNEWGHHYSKIDWKFSYGEGPLPFRDLKVFVVPELVSSGNAKAFINNHMEYSEDTFGGLSDSCTGTHLKPREFHAALADAEKSRDIALLDIRNEFEYEIGHFQGATDVKTVCYSETWKALDDVVEKELSSETETKQKIFMYCTGGIR